VRQLVWDELTGEDVERVRNWLTDNAEPSGLDDIFWVEVPPEFWSESQSEHPDGSPYCFAVEVGPDLVKFEFLIRSRFALRHPATGFATARQRQYILDYSDRLLAEVRITT
jgi:hypothetical protein